ncbi:hypothetical protein PN823_004458 [Enterobacter hormaechei]|nr:hypothetical protein [Enterobacter hormaechei]
MRDPLSFSQLAGTVARLDETRGRHINHIAIPVELPHATIGATPSVLITSVTQGFDWDSGTLFFHPQQPLTPLSEGDMEEIRRCRREGHSWAVYKARERWDVEKDALVDTINKLRTALLQRGMSTDELAELAGPAPTVRPKRRKVQQ